MIRSRDMPRTAYTLKITRKPEAEYKSCKMAVTTDSFSIDWSLPRVALHASVLHSCSASRWCLERQLYPRHTIHCVIRVQFSPKPKEVYFSCSLTPNSCGLFTTFSSSWSSQVIDDTERPTSFTALDRHCHSPDNYDDFIVHCCWSSNITGRHS